MNAQVIDSILLGQLDSSTGSDWKVYVGIALLAALGLCVVALVLIYWRSRPQIGSGAEEGDSGPAEQVNTTDGGGRNVQKRCGRRCHH